MKVYSHLGMSGLFPDILGTTQGNVQMTQSADVARCAKT